MQTIFGKPVTAAEFEALPFDKQLELVQEASFAEPVQFRIYLDAARSDYQLSLPGNFFTIVNASDAAAEIGVRFNRTDGYQHSPFQAGMKFRRWFQRVFISNTAQTGKWVDIYIAQHGLLYDFQDGRTNVNSIASVASVLSIAGLTALPSGATLVSARGLKQSPASSTMTLYTVTSGKTLYLLSASLATAGGLSRTCHLAATAADGTTFEKLVLSCAALLDNVGSANLSFLPGIFQVAAGKKLVTRAFLGDDSDTTNATIYTGFVGYEV